MRKPTLMGIQLLVFAGTLYLTMLGMGLVPGSEGLAKEARLGVPLFLSWVVSTAVGSGLEGGRWPFALPLGCLAVGFLLAFQPWTLVFKPAPWSPELPQVTAEIPENYTLFHFASAMKYVDGDAPLSGLDADLPWPHIDFCPVGVPDTRGNFIREDWSRPVWGCGSGELGQNHCSKLVWVRVAIEGKNGVEYEAKWENNNWRVTKGGRFLNFLSVAESLQNENIAAKALLGMTELDPRSGAFIPRDALGVGETLVVEGTFLVPKEYEGRVRIGDNVTADTFEDLVMKPSQKRAPMAVHSWQGFPTEAHIFLHSSLRVYKNRSWQPVEIFEREADNAPNGGSGFLFRL
jgi:hypothetical protein